MDRLAGSRRGREPVLVEDVTAEPAVKTRSARKIDAAAAAERLAGLANTCEGFYVVVAFLAYIGAGVLIFFGVEDDNFGVAPGIGLAIGITVSLLPVLVLCRWAQAYAADLTMRSDE